MAHESKQDLITDWDLSPLDTVADIADKHHRATHKYIEGECHTCNLNPVIFIAPYWFECFTCVIKNRRAAYDTRGQLGIERGNLKLELQWLIAKAVKLVLNPREVINCITGASHTSKPPSDQEM